ncbi:MAG: hypothetical protein U5N58_02985 [Actinomycetota bacterium]|nr:hypothetical protein [Actinomycetota bacterium]
MVAAFLLLLPACCQEIHQGKVCAAGVNLVAKRADQAMKGVICSHGRNLRGTGTADFFLLNKLNPVLIGEHNG